MRLLVLGQAASGKSEYAENLALRLGGRLLYIATMQPFGKDAELRISRHQKLRQGKGFNTLECYTGLASLQIANTDTVLLECLGNLAANEQFAKNQSIEDALAAVLEGVRALQGQCQNLVAVSNDVFCSGESYTAETQEYIQLLARINAALAEGFEGVAEVFCGLPHWHKGGPV